MNVSQSARIAAVVVICLTMTGRMSADKRHESLSTSGAAAIRALLQRYRTAWLAGDANAVRGAFTQDAVLMPHHGLSPVVGMQAITDFWWPAGTSKTTITKFTQTIDEIDGRGELAYVRGRSEVSWRVEDQGQTQKWRTGGNFMAILKSQADGNWLISRLIWDDPPNELLKD